MQTLKENEHCQIYDNTEFIYREYAVMQPLQRSYAITEDRINAMLSSGALSTLYDEAKVDELENMDELTGKDKNKLDNFKKNKPIYDAIIDALNSAVSDKIYKNPETFTPVVNNILSGIISDAKDLKRLLIKS